MQNYMMKKVITAVAASAVGALWLRIKTIM